MPAKVEIQETVRVGHIESLRAVGARVRVHFDASHSTGVKAPHFEVVIESITEGQIQSLAKLDADAHFVFGFGRELRAPAVADGAKYVVMYFGSDLTRRARGVQGALAALAGGAAGPFLSDVL